MAKVPADKEFATNKVAKGWQAFFSPHPRLVQSLFRGCLPGVVQ